MAILSLWSRKSQKKCAHTKPVITQRKSKLFIDSTLNQFFNENEKKKFVNRILLLAKKSKFESMAVRQSPVMDECIQFAEEAMNEHMQARHGKIYIAFNETYPSIIKIGRTSKSIDEREKSLNSAGVIGKLRMIGWCETHDSILTETYIHQRLKEFSHEKEFFNITPESAASIINECSEMTTKFYQKIFQSLRFL